MKTTEVLTVRDLVNLNTVAGFAQGCKKVRWLDEDDCLHEAVARAFVKSPDQPYFLGSDDDVRDAYLWMSSTFETFMPVREAVRLVDLGMMAED